MRIDFKDLSTALLDLSLPAMNGQPRALVLQDLRDVRGVLQRTDQLLSVRDFAVAASRLAGLDWRTTSAHLLATKPISLTGLRAAADIALPPTGEGLRRGQLSAETLVADGVSCELQGHRMSGGCHVRALSAMVVPPAWNASIGELDAGNLQAVLAGLVCRLAGILAHNVELSRGLDERVPTRPIGTVGAIRCRGLTATGRGITAEIGQLEVPEGVNLSADTLEVPTIELAAIELSIHGLVELLARDGKRERTLPLDQLLDLTQLDRLTGRLQVDVTVDATLPVIGKRVGTHEFRVPIADGIFNYRQLERGLSTLEDSVLDFEARDEYLILERDLPVIGMRKDLVRWPLPTEQDVFLANQKSVRLRTLLRPELPDDADKDSGKGDDKGKDRPIDLRRVAVENLSVELSATRNDGGPEDGERGAMTDLELNGMRLQGNLYPLSEQDGQLGGQIESLSLQIRDLPLGSLQVVQARILLEGLENLQLQFVGTTLQRLSGTLRRVRVEQLSVRLPAVAPPPASSVPVG